MKPTALLPLACVMVAAFLLGGCDFRGDVSPQILARYEQVLAGRDADGRDITRADRPAPAGHLLGDLPVRTDPATGAMVLPLSLDEAVRRALAANLDILVVQYEPAISRQELTQAMAMFDPVVFGTVQRQKHFFEDWRDETPRPGRSRTRTYNVGVRQLTPLGTEWQLAWTLTRNWDNQRFRAFRGRNESNLDLQFTQPLLRNAWPEFNLARIRIARVSRDMTTERFRQQVEDTVANVISAYWNLQRLREELVIQEDILTLTRETDRVTQQRREARPNVERRQSEVAVRQREVEIIQIRDAIGDAQDQLAQLMGFSQAMIQQPLAIVTTTEPAIVPVVIHPTDQLLTALEHNPILEQARYAIALADINVSIARNQVLPRVDLVGSVRPYGLAQGAGRAVSNLFDFDDIGYGLGVSFEYPMGNRIATAELRRRRLERLHSITAMQNTADQLAQVIHERVRQVQTTYETWLAQRATVASLEALLEGATALVELTMTLENLQLLLDSQARLGVARRQLMQTVQEYNLALVDLARVTGTILPQYGVTMALPSPLDQIEWLRHAPPAPGVVPAPRPDAPTGTPAG